MTNKEAERHQRLRPGGEKKLKLRRERRNDELRPALAERDAAQARFLEFYDLRPIGYCTLSEKGLILEANATLA